MKTTVPRLAAALVAALPVLAQADDISGSKRFICAPSQVTRCYARGDCEAGPPWRWNMPSFVQVDLDRKTLSTLPGAAEQRRSPITWVGRDQGQIFVQGTENGRAFSMVVVEATGLASMGVALDGITVSIFGACTASP